LDVIKTIVFSTSMSKADYVFILFFTINQMELNEILFLLKIPLKDIPATSRNW